jgi:hypothetical protein
MIYERIPTSTSVYELECKRTTSAPSAKVTLRIPSLPVSILATCRLINHEATPVLALKTAAFNSQSVHLTFDPAALQEFFADNVPPLSGRIQLYSKRNAALTTHDKRCRFCVDFSAAHAYQFYYSLANYLAHCSPSATVLFVDRPPFDDGAEATAELLRALRQASHWTGMPAPVRVQVPKSDLCVVDGQVIWDGGINGLIRHALQQWGVETVE